MTPRERVIEALNHREPDRVPVDFAGTIVDGITAAAYEKLKKHLGVKSPTTIVDRYQQIAAVDEKILQRFQIDFRPLPLSAPERPLAPEVGDDSYIDEWGVTRRRPRGGFYYDVIRFPLAGDITLADVEKHPWPDPYDPGFTKGLRDRAQRIRDQGYAVVGHTPSACLHKVQYLRGFEDSFIDMAMNHELFEAVMDKILEFVLALSGRMLDEVGDLLDVAYTADDLATQNGPMMSIETYRKLIKPAHKKTVDLIKSKSRAKVFYHCCGAARPFIPELIDIGVDILNPVQVSAAGMNPAELKREFGKDISFWGGIDAHRVLPRGKPEDVRAEVKRRIEEMGEGGGYVVTAVHNIQPDVPPENVCALYDAALEFGKC